MDLTFFPLTLEAIDQAAAKCRDADRGRRTVPAEHESDFSNSLYQIEGAKMFLDRLSDCCADDLAGQIDVRPQHLQIFLRQ